MSRLARVVAVDCPHHVTQRGNYRQQTFFCDDGYRLYLELLTDYSRQYSSHACDRRSAGIQQPGAGIRADAFRLRASTAHPLATDGHLWQACFYSCPLDETSQWPALAYVERNSLWARLVETADAWQWSSAAVHRGSGNNSAALELAAWRKWYDAERWRQVLATSVVEEAGGAPVSA